MNLFSKTIIFLLSAIALLSSAGCDSIDDNRIPTYPVKINLADAGLWNTYGVSGFGIYKYFIKDERKPAGFRWVEDSYSGFGGVLLIGGMDNFTTETNVPLAYDLACPVERKQNIRVAIDPENFEAVCPQCGSHYDVTMAGGAPLSGPAAKEKYGLRRYNCMATSSGGYYITI